MNISIKFSFAVEQSSLTLVGDSTPALYQNGQTSAVRVEVTLDAFAAISTPPSPQFAKLLVGALNTTFGRRISRAAVFAICHAAVAFFAISWITGDPVIGGSVALIDPALNAVLYFLLAHFHNGPHGG